MNVEIESMNKIRPARFYTSCDSLETVNTNARSQKNSQSFCFESKDKEITDEFQDDIAEEKSPQRSMMSFIEMHSSKNDNHDNSIDILSESPLFLNLRQKDQDKSVNEIKHNINGYSICSQKEHDYSQAKTEGEGIYNVKISQNTTQDLTRLILDNDEETKDHVRTDSQNCSKKSMHRMPSYTIYENSRNNRIMLRKRSAENQNRVEKSPDLYTKSYDHVLRDKPII